MRQDLDLLQGAIDIHVHSAPDLYPRIQDHAELARAAREAGFRALVLKSHNFPTAARAVMVRKELPGIDVFGSITLNLHVGRLNPIAVEAAIKYGARQIWFPTVDSVNHAALVGGETGQHGKGLVVAGGLSEYTRKAPRIRVVGPDGALPPEVREILRLIAEANVILNMGHISYEEMERLIPAARASGVRKIVVEHPYFSKITLEQQEKLVAAGALINYTAGELLPRWWRVSVEGFVAGIRRIGVANTALSSDCGQVHNPPPVEAIRITVQLLLEEGFSPAEIRTMLHENPARLLYD
ncbi:MAG: hypothetical protein HYV08_10575 [Deltaproteobacteria bacterium]|nr:hypothetical protein [Deltaproteobacteria bacterium]